MRRLWAFLRLRCPNCYRGPIFKSTWQMYETCPVCAITYEREQGYFMNAIFFGYVFGFIAVMPVTIILFLYDVSPIWFLVSTLLVLTLLSPLLFRYSRAIWMHLDAMLDPHTQEVGE